MKVLSLVILALVILLNCCNRAEPAPRRRTKTVHNPYIDVALLVDNSDSMHWNLPDTKKLWDGMTQWIQHYYTTDIAVFNKTKFAVIPCGAQRHLGIQKVKPLLYFNENSEHDTAKNVIDKFQEIKDSTKAAGQPGNVQDNVAGCAQTVTEDVFVEEKGDRPNAPNVVVYVSDCTFYYDDHELKFYLRQVMKEKMAELQKKVQLILFICTDEVNGVMARELLHDWTNSDWNKVYVYENKEHLVQKLDKFLPQITVTVTSCDFEVSTTECRFDSNGKCSKVNLTKVITLPGPAQYMEEFDKCPNNETIPCNDIECYRVGTAISTDEQVGPTSASHRTMVETEKSNHSQANPAGRPEGQLSDENDGVSGVVIGIVVGVLALLLLLILLLLLVVGGRRKKNAEKGKGKGKGYAMDQKQREKEKGMDVSMTTAGPRTNATKGKGQGHTKTGMKPSKKVADNRAGGKRTKASKSPKRR